MCMHMNDVVVPERNKNKECHERATRGQLVCSRPSDDTVPNIKALVRGSVHWEKPRHITEIRVIVVEENDGERAL